MPESSVAIHQPNFFPWLGYFNKIVRSKYFIILDDVQYPKTSKGVWSNRVKIIINGLPQYISAPINRNYHGYRNYYEITYVNENKWRNKILRTIELNYSKAPFFKIIFPYIESLFACPSNSLVEFNMNAIYTIMELLEINRKKILLSSKLNSSGSGTELLITLTIDSGEKIYLCGGGAEGYQQDDLFEKHGLKLIYQNFKHPTYLQFNTQIFQPGLSIMDTLLNCGIDKTSELIRL